MGKGAYGFWGRILSIVMLLALLAASFWFSSQSGETSNKESLMIASKIAELVNYNYLKIERKGDQFTCFYSRDGGHWHKLSDTITQPMGKSIYVGLAVASHDNKVLCSVDFDKLEIENGSRRILPDAFESRDIGKVGIKGATDLRNGEVTVSASGADISKSPDSFRFAYVKIDGDCVITGRLHRINSPHPWAKAGLMFRESLEPTAQYVDLVLNPQKYIMFMWRGNGPHHYAEFNVEDYINMLVRKTLHYLEFFILYILMFSVSGFFIKTKKRRVLLSLALCVVFAFLDEFHQVFVKGRTSRFTDVVIDTCGVVTAMILIYVTAAIYAKIKKK